MKKRSILFYSAITLLFSIAVQGLEDEIYGGELDQLTDGYSDGGHWSAWDERTASKYIEADSSGSGLSPDPCASSPCKHGGTCQDIDGNVTCTCVKGYTGLRCQTDINECTFKNGGCQDVCVNTLGGFYCTCSDPELSLAEDGRHCVAEGVELDCGQNDMTITLPKSLLVGLDREHLRLINVSCTATENATHYFLETPLTGCGTRLRHKNSGKFIIYSNMVSEIPIKPKQIVTRVRDAMIPFFCFYSKWGVVSSIGIKPVSKKVILSSKGYGKFTLRLDLFRFSNFTDPFSQDNFPIQYTIRERMYVQASVVTEDSRLSILALNCFATPSQDRMSTPRYNIIRDGCKVDDTLEYHPNPNPQTERFSLEAFQYVSQHPFIFLHCQLRICNANNPNSRCAQGCRNRKRRSEKALPENPNNEYSLAQGPLTLNREKREVESDEAVKSDQSVRVEKRSVQMPIVVALAMVIGVCVVGMSYMAYQKKRGPTARQYKPL